MVEGGIQQKRGMTHILVCINIIIRCMYENSITKSIKIVRMIIILE
jgi:hypothetical protein